MKKRYFKSSKLSEGKFHQLVAYCSVDLTAVQIAEVTGLNINTVDRYLRLSRLKSAAYFEQESPFSVTVEVDEVTVPVLTKGVPVAPDNVQVSLSASSVPA